MQSAFRRTRKLIGRDVVRRVYSANRHAGRLGFLERYRCSIPRRCHVLDHDEPEETPKRCMGWTSRSSCNDCGRPAAHARSRPYSSPPLLHRQQHRKRTSRALLGAYRALCSGSLQINSPSLSRLGKPRPRGHNSLPNQAGTNREHSETKRCLLLRPK